MLHRRYTRPFAIALFLLILSIAASVWWAFVPSHDQLILFRTWSKSVKEDITLNAKVAKDIETYLSRHNNHTASNYSVLKDEYYCVQLDKVSKSLENFENSCVDVGLRNIPLKTKVCPLHYSDRMMAAFLNGTRHQQLRPFSTLLRLLQKTPNAALIDVGANIGLFSLPAVDGTWQSRKVIAVEPNPINIQSIIAGIRANKFDVKNWAIIQRALLTTVDETVELVMTSKSTNGGIKALINDITSEILDGKSFRVKSATFDSHVLPVAKAMNITTAVLKMDMESTECIAIQGANRFLEEIYVPYILMEWVHTRLARKECREKFIEIMKAHSYVPFSVRETGIRAMLDIDDYMNWLEFDVVWKQIL